MYVVHLSVAFIDLESSQQMNVLDATVSSVRPTDANRSFTSLELNQGDLPLV